MRNYRIYHATATTGSAIASIKIVRRGQIRCIAFSILAVCGAGVDGRIQTEVSKQSVSTLNTNDTPPTVLGKTVTAANVTSGTAANNTVIPCAFDVEVGDTIYTHQVVSGTALGSLFTYIDIVVDER